jgi:glycosyltransferase involved in cell wall biosynthesis
MLSEKNLNRFLDSRQLKDLERRHAEQAALLRRARVLLPNSAIEARDCLVQLGVTEKPIVTVLIPANLEPASFWQDEKQGLMTIGRIETRKNQSGLCYALRHDPIEVNVVGASFNTGLVKLLLRLSPHVRFHGKVPRTALLEMLGSTEVHALVSWCETAGIATLEAAAAGAKIVLRTAAQKSSILVMTPNIAILQTPSPFVRRCYVLSNGRPAIAAIL